MTTLVTKGNSNTTVGNNLSIKTWTHVIANNTNRVLIVSVGIRAYQSITSITYGAQNFVKIVEKSHLSGNYARVEMWALFAPAVGTNTVTLNVSAPDYFEVNSTDYYNVLQNVVGDIETFSGTTTSAVATAKNMVTGDLMLNTICVGDDYPVTTLTVGSDQTQNWKILEATIWYGGGGTKTGTGTQQATWMIIGRSWAIASVVLKFVPDFPTPTAFIPAIFDRTADDVTNGASKAFLNVVDFSRIYSNALYINGLISANLGISITFNAVPTKTITSIITATELNTLLANTERMRQVIAPTLQPIQSIWRTGNNPSPTYLDVNLWERTLSAMYAYFQCRNSHTGVAITNAGLTRNNGFRTYSAPAAGPIYTPYTKSLLHFTGFDKSPAMIDESGKVWTTYGNVSLDASQYKFAPVSAYFAGKGSYITTPAHKDFVLGKDDFTVDFWYRFSEMVASTGYWLFGQAGANDGDTLGSIGAYCHWSLHKVVAKYQVPGMSGFYQINAANIVVANTWYHFAMVRSNVLGGISMYTNGILDGFSAYTGYIQRSPHHFSIGAEGETVQAGATYSFPGWIQEFRFSKTARWLANFTPPAAPYTDLIYK